MANAGELDALLQPAPPISWRVPRAHPVLQALPAVRIWYQGETWPRAAPRWRGTAGDVQGVPGHPLQLLIPGTRPGAHQVQLGNPERAPKGKVAALLRDGQRRRTGLPGSSLLSIAIMAFLDTEAAC